MHRSELPPGKPAEFPDLSRRGFVLTGLAAGFALAVQPVTAQTIITTDTTGLDVADATIPIGPDRIPAYRARPTGNGPFPVVLVVHEIFGLHEHIKDICRRLAKQGYLAVAPSLYARQGDVTQMADIGDIITKVVSQVPIAQVMTDLDATASWAAREKGDLARLGITGFCWGGGITWFYAEHSPQLKAGVAWYGPLTGPTTDKRPTTPLDGVKDLKAPVLGLYGGADQSIPVADVDKMREALKAAGKPGELVVYPDTPHAFNADYRPTYRPEAAKDAWARMLDWFRRYGVA